MRSEVLLCWQPQGANETPGKEKENGMTGQSVKAWEILDKREIMRACADESAYVLMKEKWFSF